MIHKTTLDNIFQIFQMHNPNPKTELDYKNHFTLTVAVILSAQATDASVNKATKSLFKEYDTPERILSLGEKELKSYIKTIGLYNAKAKNIISLCKILINEHNSQIPSNFTQLIALPGVGRKTANVILNCAFGQDTMPVDTHIYRVSHRLGLSVGKTPDKVEQDLLKLISSNWMKYAHHWLVLHGRYVCKARKPLCETCHIQQYCEYWQNLENQQT